MLRLPFTGLLAACLSLALLLSAVQARAQNRIDGIDTFPAADGTLEVGERDAVFVRFRYRLDAPAQIHVSPYFQGQATGGNSGSPIWDGGDGEGYAWFFLGRGERMDELRFSMRGKAGGGELARFPLPAVGVAAGTPPGEAPAWVAEGRQTLEAASARSRAAWRQQRDDYFEKEGGWWRLTPVMVAGGLVLLAGLSLPLVNGLRWNGGWRIAALLPLALIVLHFVAMAAGAAFGGPSLNLFPFALGLDFLVAGAYSLGLLLAHRLAARKPG